jgi:tetratricopeptide (TPR) repeat protein
MSYISSPAANPEGKKEAVPDPTFNFTSAATPEVYPAVSVDSELETTMKRPATRLQPMPQRPAAQAVQQSQAIARGKPGERPASSKAAEGNLSYKERLLKGYQHQLAGTYDDAMQEYRIIIRNAPELLSEVVSNMRALLKLAPKYSAGYRVLGDAYMRQGEYLQAMEAYNKALTMAKKAKS